MIAVYSRSFESGSGNFIDHYAPIEQHIYGSSRLGILQDHTVATSITFTSTGYTTGQRYFAGTVYPGIAHTPHDLSVVAEYDRTLGNKEYELNNHLGNVLETVSDRKLSIAQTNVLTSDFSSNTGGWSAYGASVSWDSPTQRLKVVATAAGDGTTHSMTTVRGVHYTLSFEVDITNYSIDAQVYDNSSNLIGSKSAITSDGVYTIEFTAVDNNTTVMFSAHANPPIASNNTFYVDDISIGNVALVEHYNADVLRYADYYVFGQIMPSRNGGTSYRYSFNGKETDAESDLQDYGMRIYNPALARFLSSDPISSRYPMLTPYQFASNRPVQGIDLDGLEFLNANSGAFTMSSWIDNPKDITLYDLIWTKSLVCPTLYVCQPVAETSLGDFYNTSFVPQNDDDPANLYNPVEKYMWTPGVNNIKVGKSGVPYCAPTKMTVNTGGGNAGGLLGLAQGIWNTYVDFRTPDYSEFEREYKRHAEILNSAYTIVYNAAEMSMLPEGLNDDIAKKDLMNFIIDGQTPKEGLSPYAYMPGYDYCIQSLGGWLYDNRDNPTAFFRITDQWVLSEVPIASEVSQAPSAYYGVTVPIDNTRFYPAPMAQGPYKAEASDPDFKANYDDFMEVWSRSQADQTFIGPPE